MSTDLTIYPTFTCFTDAPELLGELLIMALENGYDARNELFLCHAICISVTNARFAHAWVEDRRDGNCYFVGMVEGERKIFGAATKDYEASLNIVEVTRYTPLEVLRLNQKTNSYGPWEDKYIKLCESASGKVFIPE